MTNGLDLAKFRNQKRITMGAGIGFLLVLGGFVWLSQPKGFTDEASGWSPTPQMISNEIGVGKPSPSGDQRHVQFSNLFKQRYRSHDIAVGLKFDTPGNVRFLCAAVTPRWDMARMAITLFYELKMAFGQPYTVDIVETYISAPSRKIGEIRPAAGKDMANVTFSPLFSPSKPPATKLLPNGDKPGLRRNNPISGIAPVSIRNRQLLKPNNTMTPAEQSKPRFPVTRVD